MPLATPEAQREYQRQWVARRRAAFFGDKCCEWCRSTERLELHHRDPSKKESHAIWSWSRARRLAEIAKCIVLCRSCHQRAHGEARRVEAELRNPCGTYAAYKRGCHCVSCRAANTEYERDRRLAA
jgi:hypothetical protein